MLPKSISIDLERRCRVVFDQMLRLPEAERMGWLENHAGAEPDLHSAVLRLLAASRSGSAGILDHPIQPRPAAASSALPARIGPYPVLRCLGNGGMGIVYLCRDLQSGGAVAVKVLNLDLQTRTFLQRFENERLIQSRLRHPNVCRLLSAGENDNGTPYLVMEYVEGERIDTFCRRTRATSAQCLELLSQVLAGVAYFHQQQIVHRDLKPSNILTAAAGRVKILDFGVARIVDHQPGLTGHGATSTPVPIMTIRYASPEQLQQRVSGRSSDIYSLGVLFYELLTGQHPFAAYLAKGQRALAAAIASELPVLPSQRMGPGHGNLENVDRMVMKALSSDPAGRYSSAVRFQEDLRVCLETMEGRKG